jgi:diguanylate cyclase (GGDEF)-like protein
VSISTTVTSTAPSVPSAPPDALAGDDDDADRLNARARVFQLVRASQLDGGLTSAMVTEIIDEAERRGWPDVVKLGMYLGVIHRRYVERAPANDWIELLLERAQRDGDPVMMATALAVRSLDFDVDGGRAPVDADRDLARATVLLEGWSGPSAEASSAHIECALSFDRRDLWELQLAHYVAAEACLEQDGAGRQRLQALRYNRAEVEVNWLAALRERGHVGDLREHAARARAALEAADGPLMPDSWREDLATLRELVDALVPAHGPAVAPRRPAVGEYAGYVHLARAFAHPPGPQARRHVELALETIDQQNQQRMYLLALSLAVELEAAEHGRETYGLRWGHELLARRWERRLRSLASMQSLIEVERMTAEHALAQQHAFLDDLTGLANRRGLTRFTDGLLGRGVRSVAVALVDLDHFKLVNDGHGHAVGDEALSRMATILRGGVRDQDLVVRLGGDEFLLLLTLSDREAARRRCDTIVETVVAAGWSELSEGLTVTASVGVAFGSLEDFDGLSAAADAALYRAKQAGGGRVCL